VGAGEETGQPVELLEGGGGELPVGAPAAEETGPVWEPFDQSHQSGDWEAERVDRRVVFSKVGLNVSPAAQEPVEAAKFP